jgi:hypothetical protein
MKLDSSSAPERFCDFRAEAEPEMRNRHLNFHTSLRLRFLKTSTIKHVSRYSLLDLDRAMTKAGIEPLFNTQGTAETIASKIVSRLGLARNFRRSSKGLVFVACMGYSESKILPFAYWTEIAPYCFDCWQPEYQIWKAFFLRHRTRLAFFSARQSAQYFAKVLPPMHSVWLPEATDPAEYHPEIQLVARDIDVLELGRKHDSFHSSIVHAMIAQKRVHLFEKVKGEIVFADRSSFLNGLGRSKISVCFPCSQTHVQRSGSIETVTHRYFESMASKCILLGHCPTELSDLFGYNPVIEVESGQEAGQVNSILSNLDSYRNLVERNYKRLLEVGTWQSRIPLIVDAAKQLARRFAPEELREAQEQSLKT